MVAPRKYPDELRERATRMAMDRPPEPRNQDRCLQACR